MIREAGIEILAHALDLDAQPGALLSQIGELAARLADEAVLSK